MGVFRGVGHACRQVAGAWVALTCGLGAVEPALAEPVDYPEILIELPPPPPEDLQAFIKSAISATFLGEKLDIKKERRLEEHMADGVRLYVGAVELTAGDNFDLVEEYAGWRFIGEFGEFAGYNRLPLSQEKARGARELRELLENGFVGPNPWMNGAMCTSAFGKLDDEEMRSLVERTDTFESDWRIAAFPWEEAGFMGRTGPFEWKLGQLLYVDSDKERPENCCWDYVQKPDRTGGYVSRSVYDPLLRPYLNSHVCFGRDEEGAWKIDAVGYRTP
ncbi:hypothetical protein [Oricola indica]|uniref:hypothetical protein n=1 Tax=Oricola indica TaxID=2872591 RepID=UPI003CCBB7CC